MRRQKTGLAKGIAVAVIFIGVMAACFTETPLWGPSQAIAQQDKVPHVDAALLAAGQTLFAANCAGCHYTDQTGDKGGPSLMGLAKTRKLPTSGRDFTAENIRAQLKSPIKSMPKFDKLTDQEIKSLVAHLSSNSTKGGNLSNEDGKCPVMGRSYDPRRQL